MALRGGSGVAAAAPEAVTGREVLPSYELADPGGKLLTPYTPLGDVALMTQNLGDGLMPVSAVVSGTVTDTMTFPGHIVGSFSFNVNLQSGVLSNGSLLGNNAPPGSGGYEYSFSGGSGLASAGGWQMSMPGTILDPPSNYIPHRADLSGSGNLQSMPSGGTVAGSVDIIEPAFNTLQWTHSLSGTLTK